MKILVANWFSSRGGEEKHVFDLLTHFSRQGGHELWLAAPRSGPWAGDLSALRSPLVPKDKKACTNRTDIWIAHVQLHLH